MDKYEKIKTLHQLMKDGALTEDEFEAEKQKLMAEVDDVEVKPISDIEPVITLNEKYSSTRPTVSQNFGEPSRPAHTQHPPIQTTIIYPAPIHNRRASGVAVTGFIFTLIGIIPYLSIFFTPIGIILCFIGVTLNGKKYKKGLAIAGLVIGLLILFAWALVIFFIYNHSKGRHIDIY